MPNTVKYSLSSKNPIILNINLRPSCKGIAYLQIQMPSGPAYALLVLYQPTGFPSQEWLASTGEPSSTGMKMFKTQVETQAVGEWFHCKVLNILMSFLWSIRVQNVENYCWMAVFMSISIKVSWENLVHEKEKNKLCHQHIISGSVLLSKIATGQSVTERLLRYHKMSYDQLEKMTESVNKITIKFWK